MSDTTQHNGGMGGTDFTLPSFLNVQAMLMHFAPLHKHAPQTLLSYTATTELNQRRVFKYT